MVRNRYGRRYLVRRESDERVRNSARRRAGNGDVYTRAGVIKSNVASELNNIERVGNIVCRDLRAGESADLQVRARGSGGTEPIGIRGVGVREIQDDGLDQTGVVFTVERGEGDGVGAILKQALLDRERAGEIRLAVE